MQPVRSTLVVPNRSNYVSTVSELIDENRVFHDTYVSVRLENGFRNFIYPDYLQRNMSNRYAVHVLNDIMFNLPSDVQSVLLDKISGFQSWVTAKMYCTDAAVELYAHKVLTNLNVAHPHNKATEAFLRHKYKELVGSSTRDELDNFLVEYKKENNPLPKTTFWSHLLMQKVTYVASITFKIISFPLAMLVGFSVLNCVLNCGVKISYIVLDYALTLTVLRIIGVSVSIFAASLLISFTKLMNYNFIKFPVITIVGLTIFFVKIIEIIRDLPTLIAYCFSQAFRKVLLSVADTMGVHSAFYARIRRSCDLKDAENLFVHQVMQLKVKAG
ncbi:MAG: hypothetical protein H0W50_06520 [Parachlamydiaceae bacterium]|nr:hypothetical protein [Parachlamydiaceae bacterium]